MKKLLLVTFCLFMCAFFANAQTINLQDASVQIGDSYVQANSDYVDPGSPGVNQTWDLSGLVSTTVFTTDVVNPVGQDGFENFPNATVAFTSGDLDQVGYSAIGNNKIEVVGIYSGGTIMTFPNPRTQLQFPLSYQSTFNDTYERYVELAPGIANQEIGTVTAIVDGSGTLITPAGTFTDVLRVKLITEASLKTIMDGDVIATMPHAEVTYTYIKAGYGSPLANLLSVESAGQSTSLATYLISYPTRVDDVYPVSAVNIFPVPVVNDFTVSMDIETASEVSFNLFSIDGRMVAQLEKGTFPAGANTRLVSLPENTASGIYLLQIQTPESTFTKKIVVQ